MNEKSNGSRTTTTHYTVNDIVLRGIIAINKLLKPQPTVKKIVGKINKEKIIGEVAPDISRGFYHLLTNPRSGGLLRNQPSGLCPRRHFPAG